MDNKILVFVAYSLLLPMLLFGSAEAATYYVCGDNVSCNAQSSGWSTGDDTNTPTQAQNKNTPWATIGHALPAMSGGDVLIIGDGTYTGSDNTISTYTGATPPAGSSGAYTTIRAEHDGGVLFDGQNTRYMFYVAESTLTPKYWKFKGLVWGRTTESNVHLQNCSHVKFVNCGAYDTAVGNHTNFEPYSSSYVTYEGCYAYGTGRYKFMSYHSDHIIFRNCVGRPDAIDAGGQPAAVFSSYASTYVKVQNSIAIDADQTGYWTNIGDRQGGFYAPSTDGISQYIDFESSIALNVKLGGIQTANNNNYGHEVSFNNMVIWDAVDDGTALNVIRATNNTVNNCTFGYGGATTTDVFFWDGSGGTMTNNLLYHMLSTGSMFSTAPSTQDYNAYYANSNTTGRTGEHDVTTVDPVGTNSLKYLPRIEPGSPLYSAGSGGGAIGATVMYLVGMPETLYGETGYDTVQSAPMWPFPNEDLIKSKMSVYSSGGVSGNRGFAAASTKQRNGTDDVTLTSYIWEYLGNQMPTDIYGGVVTGSCGPSNGLSLSSAPVTGLCSAGTASAVTGTGPWSWTCAGSGGGTTENCEASLLEVPPTGNASALVACPVIAGFR